MLYLAGSTEAGSWCLHCVRGRGSCRQHQAAANTEKTIPVLSADCCVIGGERAANESRVLLIVDFEKDMVFAHVCKKERIRRRRAGSNDGRHRRFRPQTNRVLERSGDISHGTAVGTGSAKTGDEAGKQPDTVTRRRTGALRRQCSV